MAVDRPDSENPPNIGCFVVGGAQNSIAGVILWAGDQRSDQFALEFYAGASALAFGHPVVEVPDVFEPQRSFGVKRRIVVMAELPCHVSGHLLVIVRPIFLFGCDVPPKTIEQTLTRVF